MQARQCTACCGCTHLSAALPRNSSFIFENSTYPIYRFPGASGQLVFEAVSVQLQPSNPVASQPERQLFRAPARRQVVRVHSDDRAFKPAFVAKARVLSQLIRGCALDELYTVPDVTPLRTTVPNSSPPLTVSAVHGVLLATARGHSLRGLIGPLTNAYDPGVRLSNTESRVRHSAYRRLRFNSSDVLTAAVVDTLIHSSDRQLENVFVAEAAGEALKLSLIDTEEGSLDYGQRGALDSLMLPGTRIFESYASFPEPSIEAHVAQHFDYRCHVPRHNVPGDDRLSRTPAGHQRYSGLRELGSTSSERRYALGTDFPPALRTCLQSVANGSIFSAHGPWIVVPPRSFLPNRISACCHRIAVCVPENLQQRAVELLRDGLESVLTRLVLNFVNRTRSPPRCGEWVGRNNQPL